MTKTEIVDYIRGAALSAQDTAAAGGQLSELQKCAVAAMAGCEMDYEMDGNTLKIRTKNRIGVVVIDSQVKVFEETDKIPYITVPFEGSDEPRTS